MRTEGWGGGGVPRCVKFHRESNFKTEVKSNEMPVEIKVDNRHNGLYRN